MADVLLAGAGPGGLAAAYALRRSHPELDVIMVDVGREYNRRFCPVDLGKRCRGCGGICNVVSGFGGSIHYGDGVKLSLMPSGRRLIDLFGEADAYRLSVECLDLVTRYCRVRPELVGHQVADDVLATFAAHDLLLRQYPVAVLGESQLREAIAGLYEDLSRDVDLRLGTEVIAVEPAGDRYQVTLRTKRSVQQIEVGTVILATGRRGIARTQRILRELGVMMTPPDYSCGVRFEMAAEYLRATGLSHPDMKVTQRSATTEKTKTFCFCGGINGGRIKFTHYQDAFGEPIITLDGHETLERVPGDRALAGNFGLMCQSSRLDIDADLSDHLRRDVIEPYRRLNDGRPVVQTYAEFQSRAAPSRSWEALAAQLPFEPSVRDLATAPVHALFTDSQHRSLIRGFENVMRPMLELGEFRTTIDDLADQILVLGLELEFMWSHVDVDSLAQTWRPNVFVVGDAAGIAQGVIQAMMMGMRAGEAAGRSAPRGAHRVGSR